MSKREIYTAKIKLELDQLNLKMNKLDAKANEAKEDAREKYKEEMTKLRAQSKLAVAELETLKTATEDKWESMVAGVERVRDAFAHSFNYFKSQVKA